MTLAALAAGWLALAAAEPGTIPPGTAACPAMPPLQTQLTFSSGELLEYDLDALGAQAGKLYMKVLPKQNGELPVSVDAQTNTFFAKFRRVHGGGTSFLNPRTLRPSRYVEDATENEVRKTANVLFDAKVRQASIDWTVGATSGHNDMRYFTDGLDVGGAIYLLRQLPLKAGLPVCFDAYGIRHMWRVQGRVETREHISLPLGEFDAWHLSGEAFRLDAPNQKREIHVWLSDDDRRLPLVAMGVIDLGVVRATLSSFARPKERRQARAEGKETLKW